MAHSCQLRERAGRTVGPESRRREDVFAQETGGPGEQGSHGISLEVDEVPLSEADPDGIYVGALAGYPYLMTPPQVAAFTQMAPAGVRKLLSSGRPKGNRMGSWWLIPKLCLLRYLNGSG